MTNRISNPMFSGQIILLLVAMLAATLACNLTSADGLSGPKLVTEERPAIVMIAPANRNAYAAGTEVTLHAMARDIGPGVARIEFRIDVPGDPVTLIQDAPNSDGQPTLEAILTWTAVGDQTYLVEAQAYRADGTPSNLEQASIRVVNTSPVSSDTGDDTGSPPPTDETADADEAPATNLDVSGEGISGTVTGGDDVPVRQGPDTTYPTVTTLNQGDAVQIVGRSVNDIWFVIQVGDGFGWIIQASVQAEGDTANLPVVEAPPRN